MAASRQTRPQRMSNRHSRAPQTAHAGHARWSRCGNVVCSRLSDVHARWSGEEAAAATVRWTQAIGKLRRQQPGNALTPSVHSGSSMTRTLSCTPLLVGRWMREVAGSRTKVTANGMHVCARCLQGRRAKVTRNGRTSSRRPLEDQSGCLLWSLGRDARLQTAPP